MSIASLHTSGLAHNIEFYLGQRAGSEIYRHLKQAHSSVKIISPYVTPHFIKILLDLEQRGVDVTLITTEDVTKRRNVAPLLITQFQNTDEVARDKRRLGRIYSALSLIFCGALGGIGLLKWAILVYAFVGVPVFALTFYYFHEMRIYSYSYDFVLSKLAIFLSPYAIEEGIMLHAKVFIIDDKVAYLGSLNLTGKGFFDNVESRIRLSDQSAVQRISSFINNLYLDQQSAKLDAKNWGRSYFREPKN